MKASQVEVRYYDKLSREAEESSGCSPVRRQYYARLCLNLAVNLGVKSASLCFQGPVGIVSLCKDLPRIVAELVEVPGFAASPPVLGREWVGTTLSGWGGCSRRGTGETQALFPQLCSWTGPPCLALSFLEPLQPAGPWALTVLAKGPC